MLHLQARVDLNEVEASVGIEQKFHGSDVVVVAGLREPDRGLLHGFANFRGHGRGGTFLDKFLVAPLYRAVAFDESRDIPVFVGGELNLDVARLFDVLLDEHRAVAEGRLGFGRGPFDFRLEHRRVAHDAESFAAAARGGFRHDRKTDFFAARENLRVDLPFVEGHSGNAGDLRLIGQAFAAELVAQRADRRRRGADEGDALPLAGLRETRVFRKETVPGMDCVGPGHRRGREDAFLIQVAFERRRRTDANGFVGHAHVP